MMVEVGTVDAGRALRRFRQKAGLSLARLAELTHYNKGYLSKVENGRKPMTVELAQACDRVLDSCGELVELVTAATSATRAKELLVAQLPAAPRQVFGRRRALEQLEQLLVGESATGGVPVVCVDGPAGIGKTTLALRCAHAISHRFGDGTLYADLGGRAWTEEPEAPVDVLGGFLRALGAPCDGLPDTEAERAAAYRSLLVGRSVLVVLDNAATSAQVGPLVPGTTGCAVVVTSRKPLTGLLMAPAPATRLPVNPLTLDAATDLIRSVIGDRRADAEPDALAHVARRYGYLPFALRAIAVWLAAHPHVTIAESDGYLPMDESVLSWLSMGDSDYEVPVKTLAPDRAIGHPTPGPGIADANEPQLIELIKAMG
ncbi:helix-turn-helix domain-containing protein [Rhodococcus sp. ABRD24]|uniref:helix-turn-helix domain-containing protein n=1 Tax=Rhodococcus sp. ABRD24 TaxID=2507582 RepID=UPI00103C8625|nr:helix-turn-helix domain-containing protein [Rhodococcus sp. ABRD24]QBJ98213.1 helix-turn-helix domain-containing protein [Rhodococcus sp. ABRD24]